MNRVRDIAEIDRFRSINWDLMTQIRSKKLTQEEIIAFITTPGAIFMKNPFSSEKKEYIYPPLEEKFNKWFKSLPSM